MKNTGTEKSACINIVLRNDSRYLDRNLGLVQDFRKVLNAASTQHPSINKRIRRRDGQGDPIVGIEETHNTWQGQPAGSVQRELSTGGQPISQMRQQVSFMPVEPGVSIRPGQDHPSHLVLADQCQEIR